MSVSQSPPSLLSSILLMTTSCCSLPSGDLRRKDPREERINVPANPRHYWRYRMHLTLDELNAATAFNEHLRSMIAESGR